MYLKCLFGIHETKWLLSSPRPKFPWPNIFHIFHKNFDWFNIEQVRLRIAAAEFERTHAQFVGDLNPKRGMRISGNLSKLLMFSQRWQIQSVFIRTYIYSSTTSCTCRSSVIVHSSPIFIVRSEKLNEAATARQRLVWIHENAKIQTQRIPNRISKTVSF